MLYHAIHIALLIDLTLSDTGKDPFQSISTIHLYYTMHYLTRLAYEMQHHISVL